MIDTFLRYLNILMLFLCLSVYAQSADVITDILETEEITFGQVCYLTAVQMNIIDDSVSYEGAVTALYEHGYIPEVEDFDAPVPAVDLAYLYSKLWNIKGGLMYRLTKGSPRYAFQQFKIDGIIPRDENPTKKVSGQDVLNVFSQCEYIYGGEK